MALLAARKFRKPLFAFIHAMEWQQLTHIIMRSSLLKSVIMYVLEKLERYVYNKCDVLIVPSKNVAEELAALGITTRKAIIPLGVDSQRFLPPDDKQQAKRAVGLKPEDKVIGYCGRLSAEKDLKTLAKAFAWLQERHPTLQLLIVGDGNKKMITHHAEKNVHITGFVDDVVPYLQAMDVFVMPSLTETSSLATMEAMSVGLPVVSTHVGNIRYYITDGRNGFLFPTGDVDYLKKKLARLIEHEELRRATGILARKTMVMKFHWEKTVEMIQEVLG